jgi:hypothetical protein
MQHAQHVDAFRRAAKENDVLPDNNAADAGAEVAALATLSRLVDELSAPRGDLVEKPNPGVRIIDGVIVGDRIEIGFRLGRVVEALGVTQLWVSGGGTGGT